MCISWPRICFTVHLLWCVSYTTIGIIQVIFGVFFIALPVLKLGSNIWVGIWNIIFGIGGVVYAMIGKWTLNKQRIFLYVAISVLIANVINLVVLEVGEWHILLPGNFKKSIEQGNLKMVVLYARTIISLGTILVALIAFVDSQITFCSMQYHERYHRRKQNEKHDILSDTEYILPRVKSDSDENENASFYNKQYPQSWVYKTQTAETSTINSATAPNRFSGSSSDNLIDSKQTPSETEFKDISTQNLSIEQPIVVVENTSDYTDRQLHYMASFSRTPSPVPGSDSSSENSYTIPAPVPPQASQTSSSKRNSAETFSIPSHSSGYRARLDSAKSTSAVPCDRPSPSVSPRPPSISGIDQLQTDLQERISNKSFKISADQIFIPLKDETVIRINDEVFVTPNKRTTAATTTPTTTTAPPPHQIEAKRVARPSLPEVVQVLRKENLQKDSSPPTYEKGSFSPSSAACPPNLEYAQMKDLSSAEKRYSSPPLATHSSADRLSSSCSVAERPKSVSTAVERTAASPHVKCASPVTEKQLDLDNIPPPRPTSQQSLQETVEQLHVQSHSTSVSTAKSTPSPDESKSSSSLERQTKIERDDTVTSTSMESESITLSSPQFERQDTVVCARTPTPQSDRQSIMERQDAIISPKDDKSCSYITVPADSNADIPSPIETEAGTSRHSEDELRTSDDPESNNSNNTTIIDFKSSQSDIEMASSYRAVAVCDTPDLIEGTLPPSQHHLGNEIDNIFRIAEVNGDLVRDKEDAELFAMGPDDEGVDNIPPPPDMDAHAFVNIPPPEDVDDELNGVDPDEWEESEDDSVDSSCVRPIPQPATPNNK